MNTSTLNTSTLNTLKMLENKSIMCYSSGFEFTITFVILIVILLIPTIKLIPEKFSEDTNFDVAYSFLIIMLAIISGSSIFIATSHTKVSLATKISFVLLLSISVLAYLLKTYFASKSSIQKLVKSDNDTSYNDNISIIFKWVNIGCSMATFIFGIIMSYQLFSTQ